MRLKSLPALIVSNYISILQCFKIYRLEEIWFSTSRNLHFICKRRGHNCVCARAHTHTHAHTWSWIINMWLYSPNYIQACSSQRESKDNVWLFYEDHSDNRKTMRYSQGHTMFHCSCYCPCVHSLRFLQGNSSLE